MPPVVCSRLFVWPSTLWPCTKCDRNIFSFYEKIPLIFWPAAAVSLQWISLPFRTIVAAIFCHPKYVTHVLCHTCSLAVLHVVMWRTKVSWSNTIQGLSNFVGGVSCHVITLLLRKMSWFFFCDFRAILVSLWLLKEIAQANYYVLRYLSSFSFQPNQISTTVPDIHAWRFSGAYKKLRCAALWWMRSWIISLSVYKVTNLHTLIRIPVRLFLRSYRNKREENHRQIPGTLITAGTLIRLRRVLYVRNLSRNHTALQYTSMS